MSNREAPSSIRTQLGRPSSQHWFGDSITFEYRQCASSPSAPSVPAGKDFPGFQATLLNDHDGASLSTLGGRWTMDDGDGVRTEQKPPGRLIGNDQV